MKNLLVVSVIALGTALAPHVAADAANQLTKVTFSGPVEIPGQVLPAGTYEFKVLDFNAPDIVQIMNQDGTKVYGTLLAIPDYRQKPTGKTVITFSERKATSPEAVRAWFYPGDNYGHEFVYPKPRAAQLAKLTGQSVPSMPANLEPIRSQIDNFDQSVQQNHTDVVSKINQWWDQTTDWMMPGKESRS